MLSADLVLPIALLYVALLFAVAFIAGALFLLANGGQTAAGWVRHWGDAKRCRYDQGAPPGLLASLCEEAPGMELLRAWPVPRHGP